jgi:hypothetical protein
MTTRHHGPRRSNSALSIVRGIKSLKVFYWTNKRLKTIILPYINAREVHYERAFSHIEKLLANGHTIESRHDPLVLLQEYDRRAPHENEIDRRRLLEVYDKLDERAKERLAAIIDAERDRLDLAGARVIPSIRLRTRFPVKQYPIKDGTRIARFAPHTSMTKETRELAKELKAQGKTAVIIDCQDEGAFVKISRENEPEVFADRRIRKLWRRHDMSKLRKWRH